MSKIQRFRARNRLDERMGTGSNVSSPVVDMLSSSTFRFRDRVDELVPLTAIVSPTGFSIFTVVMAAFASTTTVVRNRSEKVRRSAAKRTE